MQIPGSRAHGYVNLFYLIAALRGCGSSGELHAYAMSFCRRHGMQSARLSVSPSNARALGYYRRHGWRDLGPRPGHEHVHLMECDVSTASAGTGQ